MRQKVITRLEFEIISKEWTRLDTLYDTLFQEFLDNPHVKPSEELSRFKTMQNRLYEIELQLYEIAEGIAVIQD